MLQLLLLFPGQSLVWYVEYQWVGQVKPPEVYPEIKVGSKGGRNQKTRPSTLLYFEEFFSNPADTSNSWVNGSFKTWGLHLLTTYCLYHQTSSCICPRLLLCSCLPLHFHCPGVVSEAKHHRTPCALRNLKLSSTSCISIYFRNNSEGSLLLNL